MVLKIAISKDLLVLSPTIKQVFYAKINIHPILTAIVIALNIYTDVICLWIRKSCL